MPLRPPFPTTRAFRRLLALALCVVVTAACTNSLSLSTRVLGTWKDPKYASAPLTRIFVISLMRVEPGGRDAVEDAIVARLAAAGVTAVASHTLMSNDPLRPGPSLPEAIATARRRWRAARRGARDRRLRTVHGRPDGDVAVAGHDGVLQVPEARRRRPVRRLQGRAHRERAVPAVDGQAGVDRVHQFVRRQRPRAQHAGLHAEAGVARWRRTGSSPAHRHRLPEVTAEKEFVHARLASLHLRCARSRCSPLARPRRSSPRGTTRATRAAC